MALFNPGILLNSVPLIGGIDSYTVLAIHCDGADTSTTFTDASSSGHTVTANGDAQVDTAQKKFGTGSVLLDGSGDFLSVADHADFDLGANDFTVDFWIRFAVVTGAKGFMSKGTASGYGPFLLYRNGTTVYIYLSSTGSSWDLASGTSFGTVAADTWYHVALVRSGTNIYGFLNGSLNATIGVSTTALYDGTDAIGIGCETAAASVTFINARMDEIRWSKDIARWISGFTPPAQAYS